MPRTWGVGFQYCGQKDAVRSTNIYHLLSPGEVIDACNFGRDGRREVAHRPVEILALLGILRIPIKEVHAEGWPTHRLASLDCLVHFSPRQPMPRGCFSNREVP